MSKPIDPSEKTDWTRGLQAEAIPREKISGRSPQVPARKLLRQLSQNSKFNLQQSDVVGPLATPSTWKHGIYRLCILNRQEPSCLGYIVQSWILPARLLVLLQVPPEILLESLHVRVHWFSQFHNPLPQRSLQTRIHHIPITSSTTTFSTHTNLIP